MMISVRLRAYVCGLSGNNVSLEHIIPNAIGGKLKSKELICEDCNSSIGSKYDSILCKQMEFFSNFIEIKRDRGKPKPIEMKHVDEDITYTINGVNNVRIQNNIREIKNDDGTKTFKGSFNSEKEARKHIESIIKKYPNASIKLIPIKEPIGTLKKSIQFGGAEVSPAITKIATNFYIYKGLDRNYIKHLIPHIQSCGDKPIAKILTSNYFSYDVKDDEICHSIYLEGNKDSKILFSIITLFGSISYLVVLNENYENHDFKYVYSYDLINSIENENASKNKNYKIRIDYESFKNYKYSPTEDESKKMEGFIKKNSSSAIKNSYFNMLNNIKNSNTSNSNKLKNAYEKVISHLLSTRDCSEANKLCLEANEHFLNDRDIKNHLYNSYLCMAIDSDTNNLSLECLEKCLELSKDIDSITETEIKNIKQCLGIKYFDNGFYEKCIKIFKEYISIGHNNLEALYFILDSYFLLKDHANILLYSDKILKIDENNIKAHVHKICTKCTMLNSKLNEDDVIDVIKDIDRLLSITTLSQDDRSCFNNIKNNLLKLNF